MSRALVLVAVVATLVVPATVAASGSTAFADPSGDTTGPDITTVAVSNDDSGLITFAVSIPNRPGLVAGMGVVLLLNTDKNDTTGNRDDDGADYAIEYDNGQPRLGKWDGTSSWDWTVPHASVVSTYIGGLTVKVSAAELGGTTGFSFYAVALQDDATDFAPDANQDDWSYAVQIAPPAAKPPVAPAPKPKARPAKKPAKKKKKH